MENQEMVMEKSWKNISEILNLIFYFEHRRKCTPYLTRVSSLFATLICITNAQTCNQHTFPPSPGGLTSFSERNSVLCEKPPDGPTRQQLTTAPASQSKCIFSEKNAVGDVKITLRARQIGCPDARDNQK